MSVTAQRLSQIREIMAQQNIDAFVLSTFDEYLNEYVPERNKRLQWLSGFTGSAGVAVVLKESAAIFVDGRYTVQVRQQVEAEQFSYHHLVEEPYANWLTSELKKGQKVGLDSRMFNLDTYQKLENTLTQQGIELISLEKHPVDTAWTERPAEQVIKGMLLGLEYTGQNSIEKRELIAAELKQKNLDAALIFAPDSVAWLLNIRGRDIPATPVILGYAVLSSDASLVWFTNPQKIPEGFEAHVGEGVSVVDEADAAEMLSRFSGQRILADPFTANAWSQKTLADNGAQLVAGSDPVIMPKACKNETEQEGMRQAHIRDGVAEVKFLCWLDDQVSAGEILNEAQLADKLFSYRAQQDKFQEVSFDTISAAGSNAAMCHYNHNNGTPAELPENGVYLVDSGGQYFDGTTDITRTVAIGSPSEEIREQFTRVLKGYIALETARFPNGTTGTQLDILARQFLWQEGYDFDHGTGHGVGSYLSVHEGPQRIGKAYNATVLKPGMVISNEPGFYKADAYGIRCENLVMVKEASSLAGNVPMLEFEVLTLAPFDLRLVDEKLLTDEETQWLNAYHQQVYDTLSDLLEETERQWLAKATRSI